MADTDTVLPHSKGHLEPYSSYSGTWDRDQNSRDRREETLGQRPGRTWLMALGVVTLSLGQGKVLPPAKLQARGEE